MIYSHDTFGLGHIRRCRTIAHALAEAHPKLRVLIVSGSPIIGSFDFKARVDFVRVPGIVKLRSGDYVPLGHHGSLRETTALRSALIRETALRFEPDVFIVDKEPLGLRGELAETLQLLKGRGTRLVLGLRDVLDEPRALKTEWARKNAFHAVESIYDEILVYGLKDIHDPLSGLGLGAGIAQKTVFTGYLRRKRPVATAASSPPDIADRVLVTAGGGGDGEALVDWVLSAYETGSPGLPPAIIVPGPFMRGEAREAFALRASSLPTLRMHTFEPRMEHLMADCLAVVSMGGYNTFCEILSFDKRALVVPRREPRQEQTIRAEAARRRHLINILPDPAPGLLRDADTMVKALRALPMQSLPSASAQPGLLNGLPNLIEVSHRWFHAARGEADTP